MWSRSQCHVCDGEVDPGLLSLTIVKGYFEGPLDLRPTSWVTLGEIPPQREGPMWKSPRNTKKGHADKPLSTGDFLLGQDCPYNKSWRSQRLEALRSDRSNGISNADLRRLVTPKRPMPATHWVARPHSDTAGSDSTRTSDDLQVTNKSKRRLVNTPASLAPDEFLEAFVRDEDREQEMETLRAAWTKLDVKEQSIPFETQSRNQTTTVPVQDPGNKGGELRAVGPALQRLLSMNQDVSVEDVTSSTQTVKISGSIIGCILAGGERPPGTEDMTEAEFVSWLKDLSQREAISNLEAYCDYVESLKNPEVYDQYATKKVSFLERMKDSSENTCTLQQRKMKKNRLRKEKQSAETIGNENQKTKSKEQAKDSNPAVKVTYRGKFKDGKYVLYKALERLNTAEQQETPEDGAAGGEKQKSLQIADSIRYALLDRRYRIKMAQKTRERKWQKEKERIKLDLLIRKQEFRDSELDRREEKIRRRTQEERRGAV